MVERAAAVALGRRARSYGWPAAFVAVPAMVCVALLAAAALLGWVRVEVASLGWPAMLLAAGSAGLWGAMLVARTRPGRSKARANGRDGAMAVPEPDGPTDPADELQRALIELRLIKRLNDGIIHNIPGGIAILNDAGLLLYLNAGFERLWGVKLCCLGKSLQEVGADGPLGEIDWAAEMRRLKQTGEPQRDVVIETGQWPDRRVVRYTLVLLPSLDLDTPLQSLSQNYCRAVIQLPSCSNDCEDCFARQVDWSGRHALLLIDDITQQRQLEAQLIQSEKLAALGQLSAGIAHEIRNPLSAICSAAFYIGDVLTDDEPDLSDLEQYVALIQRNIERAQRTVTDILNFARPTGPDPLTADLAELAEQTLAILDKSMVDQGVELRQNLQPVRVRCRPETVKQALLNLIVNALQAMPDGGVMTLNTGPVDGLATLTVSDTGTGIEPQHLKQVFNPFFTTKPAGQGTGLGLSIARQAIEADSGRLEVESEPGCGTTFTMILPSWGDDPVESGHEVDQATAAGGWD